MTEHTSCNMALQALSPVSTLRARGEDLPVWMEEIKGQSNAGATQVRLQHQKCRPALT
jgi:hypothetical protein